MISGCHFESLTPTAQFSFFLYHFSMISISIMHPIVLPSFFPFLSTFQTLATLVGTVGFLDR